MRERKVPAAPPADAPSENLWSLLSWDNLKNWAGQRTVSRGRAYRTAVHELAVSADGRLLAWVQGTRRYATAVGVAKRKSGDFQLNSHCSCPVGIGCKHAVALVVAYLHAIKSGQEIPSTTEDDRRWQILENPGRASEDDAMDDEDFHGDDAEDGTDMHESIRTSISPRRNRSASRTKGGNCGNTHPGNIRAFLERKSLAELVDLLTSVLQRNPEERERMQEAADLSRGATSRLVQQARRELESVTAEPAWTNRWGDEGKLPDYSGLRRRFENLLAAGAADALVELGKELLQRGTQQIGESHDEGITAGGIGGCMAIVFRAVMASSLTDAGKVLYAVEAQLEDEYDLCEGAGLVLDNRWPTAIWSEVADALRERFKKLPQAGRAGWSDRGYRRGRLVERIAELLDRAGRSGDVVPLFEAEVVAGGSHERLVKRLVEEKRLDDAARRAEEGIALSPPDHEAVRARLQELLRQIAEKRRDKPVAAAWRAADFFQSPSLNPTSS